MGRRAISPAPEREEGKVLNKNTPQRIYIISIRNLMGMESKGKRSCLFFWEQSFQGSRNLGGNEVRIKPQQFRARGMP